MEKPEGVPDGKPPERGKAFFRQRLRDGSVLPFRDFVIHAATPWGRRKNQKNPAKVAPARGKSLFIKIGMRTGANSTRTSPGAFFICASMKFCSCLRCCGENRIRMKFGVSSTMGEDPMAR